MPFGAESAAFSTGAFMGRTNDEDSAPLLARSQLTQADLVEQLFTSNQERFARVLLLMSEFGKSSEPRTLLAELEQPQTGNEEIRVLIQRTVTS
jgi:hypothetical protein